MSNVYFFAVAIVVASITGILFNPYTFTPFHFLGLVVCTTIPLAIYNFRKASYYKGNRGIFFNFIGLNLAGYGAMEPERYLGRRVWSIFDKVDIIKMNNFNIWLIGFGVAAIIATVMVFRSIKNKDFFL